MRVIIFTLSRITPFWQQGFICLPRSKLDLIRQEIVFNPGAYLEVINDPGIVNNYERGGKEDRLKKGPVGFPKEFEYIDEIKYKHYIFSKNYEREEVLKG